MLGQQAVAASEREGSLPWLTAEFRVKHHREICVEDLTVSGMAENRSLAWHSHDAAWGETRR